MTNADQVAPFMQKVNGETVWFFRLNGLRHGPYVSEEIARRHYNIGVGKVIPRVSASVDAHTLVAKVVARVQSAEAARDADSETRHIAADRRDAAINELLMFIANLEGKP